VFTPPPKEVERARRILDALDQAAREGRGAAQLDGRMIDAASARMAQNVVNTAETIKSKARVTSHQSSVSKERSARV
jgi:malyl-CoA/(S)-citramalyl-CoA lyase